MNGIYIAELYKSNPDAPDVFKGERTILGDTGIKIGPDKNYRIYKNMFERSSYEIFDSENNNVFQMNSDLSLSKIGDVRDFESLEAVLNHVSNVITNDEAFFEDDETYDYDAIEESLTRVIASFDDNDEISRAHLMMLVDDIIELVDFDNYYNDENQSSEDYCDDSGDDYSDDSSDEYYSDMGGNF